MNCQDIETQILPGINEAIYGSDIESMPNKFENYVIEQISKQDINCYKNKFRKRESQTDKKYYANNFVNKPVHAGDMIPEQYFEYIKISPKKCNDENLVDYTLLDDNINQNKNQKNNFDTKYICIKSNMNNVYDNNNISEEKKYPSYECSKSHFISSENKNYPFNMDSENKNYLFNMGSEETNYPFNLSSEETNYPFGMGSEETNYPFNLSSEELGKIMNNSKKYPNEDNIRKPIQEETKELQNNNLFTEAKNIINNNLNDLFNLNKDVISPFTDVTSNNDIEVSSSGSIASRSVTNVTPNLTNNATFNDIVSIFLNSVIIIIIIILILISIWVLVNRRP